MTTLEGLCLIGGMLSAFAGLVLMPRWRWAYSCVGAAVALTAIALLSLAWRLWGQA